MNTAKLLASFGLVGASAWFFASEKPNEYSTPKKAEISKMSPVGQPHASLAEKQRTQNSDTAAASKRPAHASDCPCAQHNSPIVQAAASAEISANELKSLFQLQRGDSASIQLATGQKLTGTTTMLAEHGEEWSTVAIDLTAESNAIQGILTMHINQREQQIAGTLVNQNSALAYQLEQLDQQNYQLTPVAATSLFCAQTSEDPEIVTLGMTQPAEQASDATAPADSESPEDAQGIVPVLNSQPTASACIYLDFDGQRVSGTIWNSSYNSGNDIVVDAATSKLNSSQITSIWKGVSARYAPFNVNVTTEEAAFLAAPATRRIRVVLTPANTFYGSGGTLSGAAGTAYVNSFSSSYYSASDTPTFVFTNHLYNNAAYIVETVTHESGHTLGLSHDGKGTTTYYQGHGDWAPIMGIGYYDPLVQWSKGEYTGSTNTQDDLAIISGSNNGFGYRSDDFGNTNSNASELIINSATNLSQTGLIHKSSDRDVFSFSTAAGSTNITVNQADYKSMLDVKIELYNAAGSLIASANPTTSFNASINMELDQGDYYLHVIAGSQGTASTGFTSYSSLGNYNISATIAGPPTLPAPQVAIISPSTEPSVTAEQNVLQFEGEVNGTGSLSASWSVVAAPAGVNVEIDDPAQTSTEMVFPTSGNYTIRLTGSNEDASSYSEINVTIDYNEAQLLAQQDPNGDADADGLNNLLEYALGSDNTELGHNGFCSAINQGDTAGMLLSLPSSAPDDVRYSVEASSSMDPNDWVTLSQKDGNGNWTGSATVHEITNENGVASYCIEEDNNSPVRFYRLVTSMIQ